MKQKRTYGGRKTLPESIKKTDVIRVRLTQKQIVKLRKLYENSNPDNLSDLIRKVLFQRPIPVTVYSYDLSNVLLQLDRMKVTMNAIVKQENEIDTKNEIEAMKNELLQLKEILSAYKKTELLLNDLNDIDVKD